MKRLRLSMTYHSMTWSNLAELVNSGVKTLAMSEVLPPADLLVTDLVPADLARGKDVLLIYQGATLDQYQTLKAWPRGHDHLALLPGPAADADLLRRATRTAASGRSIRPALRR
jgi:hypothetical protein